jgi:hypothetical protein
MKIDDTQSIASMYLASQTRSRTSGGSHASHGDTVTLSSEAKRLLEHFRAMRFEKDKDAGDTSKVADSGSTTPSEDVDDGPAAADSSASAGASGGSDAAEQAEDLRKRIKDLMDKVKNIMNSDMSPEQKHSAAAPFLQQVQELQQQLQSLVTEQRKGG